jgi:formate hydrogenlyase subunit 3/multisubunit Na+/H+ antiporter MnhD subunit
MIPLTLIGVLALALLAIPGILWRDAPAGRIAVYGGALAISLALLAAALFGADGSVRLPLGVPWIGAHFAADALARAFLVLINLGAAAASLYALGYGRHERAPGRVLPFYPVFLAGMNLVPLAADAFSFLFAWELMSLASWALVLADHDQAENRRAGLVYLAMAVFGGLALLLAFGLLAGGTGGYLFADMRAAPPEGWRAGIILALVLLGAGSKAGLVPLHVWLPLAHPAAPSHVSALMSGVMTKVAVYACIRILFDLLGPASWWWAVPLLVLGAASAVLGVLMALLERDLKRLLACSSIENIGVVFLALGLALAFRANAMPDAAALALTAALFHAFNHMGFKSLLFFGAGAVLHATGTRDIERQGGLIHRMPLSAGLFLAGCMAISALPPLNGFASEWLLLQSILISPDLPQWTLRLAVPACGAALALAAALAAACFVRAFGIVHLGRPRSPEAATAHETDRFSLAAMAILAVLCLLAGLFPGLVMDALAPVSQQLAGARLPSQAGQDWLTVIPVERRHSTYNGALLALFVLLSAGLIALAARRFAAAGLRRSRLWDCGYPHLGPAAQYTAASLAQPIRRVFATVLLGAREEVRMPPPGATAPAEIRLSARDPAWDTLYAPLAGAIDTVALRLNALQFLTIRRYLSFVFLTLILLLTALAVWQ